jgi:prepilin-type N-terminal cleavage/methylation domain-containing protein
VKKIFINQSGFTFIELLAALTILSVVLGSIAMFYFPSLKFWGKGNETIELQQHGRIAMNRMVRELRQAKEVFIPNNFADEITFTTLNEEQFRFYLSGNQLLRSKGNNPLASYVQSVNFSYLNEGRTVMIQLNLENKGQSFELRSAVTPRNLLDSSQEESR